LPERRRLEPDDPDSERLQAVHLCPFRFARHPAQLANHWFPLTYTTKDTDPTQYAVDDRDWNITYKLSVAVTACTTTGLYCDYALGNGPFNAYGTTTQTDMGFWSDGTLFFPSYWSSTRSALFRLTSAR